MKMREKCEQAIRRFHALELHVNGAPVIDYDCTLNDESIEPFTNRFAALDEFQELRASVPTGPIADQLEAHIAYLSALLGEQSSLRSYIARTQGCQATGWSNDYIQYRQDIAKRALTDLDIPWNEHSKSALRSLDLSIPVDEIASEIQRHAAKHEMQIREMVATRSEFKLTIDNVRSNEYWSYWLDGSGHNARLRINLNNASFTQNDAYRFALHEILGHALQYASLTDHGAAGNADWIRLLAVHSNHQVLCEGLAQLLPLLADPDNLRVNAAVRLDHYLQLVRAELHLKINSGVPVTACWQYAQLMAPMLEPSDIDRELRDRSYNPRLRSYLWAYPAGIDWFMNLFEQCATLVPEVLSAAYKQPLSPNELQQFWPTGPAIGGSG